MGPNLQDDISLILIRFRLHKYVLIADIEKIYRQVLVDPRQRDFQRILWRQNPQADVEHYRLNTITYGTAPASFLAVRCLQQIGYDCQERFPEASRCILEDFYMDDLLTGTNNIKEAIELKKNLIQILEGYGFSFSEEVAIKQR